MILLMEENPKQPPVGCIKPGKQWDKLPTSTEAGFLNHQQYCHPKKTCQSENLTVSSPGFFFCRPRLVEVPWVPPWYGFGLLGCCWPFHLHWFYTNTASSHASPEACRDFFWFGHQRQNKHPFHVFLPKNETLLFVSDNHKLIQPNNIDTQIWPQKSQGKFKSSSSLASFSKLLSMSCWVSPTRVPQKNGWNNAINDAPPTFKRFTTLVVGLVQRSRKKIHGTNSQGCLIGKNLHQKNTEIFVVVCWNPTKKTKQQLQQQKNTHTLPNPSTRT